MSELDCLRCNDQPSSKILISSCSSLPAFRGELSDSSCTLFSPSPSISLHPSPLLSILPLSLVPRAPDGSLTSAHLCLYISEAECKRCSDLSRLGKGGTDFWMTDLLRSCKTNFKRNQGLTVKPISWLTRRITV